MQLQYLECEPEGTVPSVDGFYSVLQTQSRTNSLSHGEAQYIDTYSRKTVINEHVELCMVELHTRSVVLHLSPPEDYAARYLTPLLQKNVAWKSSKQKTVIHLSPALSIESLVGLPIALVQLSLHVSAFVMSSLVNGVPLLCVVVTY